jgi:uncharacterized protein
LHTGLAGIPEGADLRLDVTLESVTEGVLATVTAVAPVTGECARCLEPVAQMIEVRCQELFSYEQGADEDGYALDGDLLDLEPVLRDALLAQAGPEHGHERAIDPRWAGLRQPMIEIREESGRGRP